jgi:hypothetical protein
MLAGYPIVIPACVGMTRWIKAHMFGEKKSTANHYIKIKIALIFVYFLAAGFASAQSVDVTVSSNETILLNQAKITFTDSDRPPPDSALWQPQPLPDNWNR